MRQKIKGACWNTTTITAEQSTIFSKGIKIMTFCSGFYFASILRLVYRVPGHPKILKSINPRSGVKQNLTNRVNQDWYVKPWALG